MKYLDIKDKYKNNDFVNELKSFENVFKNPELYGKDESQEAGKILFRKQVKKDKQFIIMFGLSSLFFLFGSALIGFDEAHIVDKIVGQVGSLGFGWVFTSATLVCTKEYINAKKWLKEIYKGRTYKDLIKENEKVITNSKEKNIVETKTDNLNKKVAENVRVEKAILLDDLKEMKEKLESAKETAKEFKQDMLTTKDILLIQKFKLLNDKKVKVSRNPFLPCSYYWIYADVALEDLIIPEGLIVEKRLYNEYGCNECHVYNKDGKQLGTLDVEPQKKIKEENSLKKVM